MQNTKRNIAIIGAGYWGKNLVRNLYQIGCLAMICDGNQEVLSDFKAQYPDVDICLSPGDLINRDDIDSVMISTPAETHYDLAKKFLLAGKHVFIEKPFVLDTGEGEELVKIADDGSLVLMVGHLIQYHSAFIKLRSLIKEGELGRINYIYSNRLNLGKIRREENILWSFAPHDISMILALTDEMPDLIKAKGSYYLHQKIADVTITQLEFPSGINAHIFVSWLHPFKEQKLVVVGDRKMAVFDDTQPWDQKLTLFAHRIKWINNIPVPDKADPEAVEVEQSEPLKAECKHFLFCVNNGVRPITDGREGLNVLKVLKASQHCLDNGNA